MRPIRFLAIPVILLFLMACSLSSLVQGVQQAQTQIPGFLTSAPTTLGAVETAAAANTSNCGTPTSTTGLGVTLDSAKNVLQLTQQVTFTEGTYNGQPDSTATLASAGASSFPTIASGFSAQFIGDPCNLSEILVTIPRTSDQATLNEGLGIMNILFAAFLPPDITLQFLPWVTQNYSNVPAGGQAETTIGKMQFTLKRSQNEIMTLDILPAP